LGGSSKISSDRDLLVSQRALELAVVSYAATKQFPRDELYGLTSQIRRSASSVAANIAEGYGRESAGSYVQFLRTAQGSLKEFETHIILAQRVDLVSAIIAEPMLEKSNEVGRMLRSLIRSIQNSAGGDQ
jgi:four helix bundle protein